MECLRLAMEKKQVQIKDAHNRLRSCVKDIDDAIEITGRSLPILPLEIIGQILSYLCTLDAPRAISAQAGQSQPSDYCANRLLASPIISSVWKALILRNIVTNISLDYPQWGEGGEGQLAWQVAHNVFLHPSQASKQPLSSLSDGQCVDVDFRALPKKTASPGLADLLKDIQRFCWTSVKVHGDGSAALQPLLDDFEASVASLRSIEVAPSRFQSHSLAQPSYWKSELKLRSSVQLSALRTLVIPSLALSNVQCLLERLTTLTISMDGQTYGDISFWECLSTLPLTLESLVLKGAMDNLFGPRSPKNLENCRKPPPVTVQLPGLLTLELQYFIRPEMQHIVRVFKCARLRRLYLNVVPSDQPEDITGRFAFVDFVDQQFPELQELRYLDPMGRVKEAVANCAIVLLPRATAHEVFPGLVEEKDFPSISPFPHLRVLEVVCNLDVHTDVHGLHVLGELVRERLFCDRTRSLQSLTLLSTKFGSVIPGQGGDDIQVSQTLCNSAEPLLNALRLMVPNLTFCDTYL